ncbi:MAG: metallopeptidase family protein [SAR202 cluster bacterium]|nr:metallopeptidase family protein [SAR202 cluster bacterium]
MKREQFEQLVVRALESLPPRIQAWMDNVDVLVEDWPSDDDLDEGDVEEGDTLFGLYKGIPLTERGDGYNMVLPDTITIYQGPLEEAFPTAGEIVEQVRITVAHEIAHHFGISDEQLEEWGLG